MRWIRFLAQIITPNPVIDESTHQLVYRVVEASRIEGAYEKRIVELADGRSIGQIVEALYREEVNAGAWEADIGLWKGLFSKCLIEVIGNLTQRGYISLAEDGENEKTRSATEASQQRQESLEWQTPLQPELRSGYPPGQPSQLAHPGQSLTQLKRRNDYGSFRK